MRAWSKVASGLAALALLLTAQAAPSRPAHAGLYSRYAVAADHPLASEAGAAILAEGGNAADAVAATMLALGAVSPASSGLGGGGFALYYRASDRSLTFLDFREVAPGAATADMFARREGDDDATAAARSQTGGLAVGVPGEPAGIDALISRFGSRRVTRAQIAAPAERYAREGVPASRYVSQESRGFVAQLRQDALLAGWLSGDTGIERGATITNPQLAATLRTFGRQGARAFYRGAIARAIVDAVRARGGVMTLEDLAGYRVRERAPLEGEAFGRRWVSAPPPSAGGIAMLHSLALLEAWQPEGGWREGPAFRHALTQSWIGAYLDRAAYLGDPDHADVPVERLLAPERLARRAALFDRDRALPAERWELPLEGVPSEPAAQPVGGGTSHVCVIDEEGNVASVTTTINLQFGARVSAAGIVLNDEMDDFARELGAPNAFGLPGGAANLPRPGARPVSSMAPTIVFEGTRPVMCVGASGGSRIPTATEQVALFSLLLGDELAEAMTRPRVHQQGRPGTTFVEPGVPLTTRLALWGMGHDLSETPTVANVQTIRIVRREGVIELHAASDPRKDGEPRGE